MSVVELLVAGEWAEALYQLPFMVIQAALAYAFVYFAWQWVKQTAERDERRRRREQWIDTQIEAGSSSS